MAVINLTDKFLRQQDGTYQATFQGGVGALYLEHASDASAWTELLSVAGTATPHHENIIFGTHIRKEFNFSPLVTLIVRVRRKPVNASVAVSAGTSGDVPEQVEQMAQQVGQMTEQIAEQKTLIEKQQTIISEQTRINELQQEQIEKNKADNDTQQEQIDRNTEINNQQEAGLGDERVNELVQKVFGA